MECVLSLDQGTTGSRAVLYGRDGNQIASSYREFPQHFPQPGWVEHDAEEIWMSVVACIDDVRTRVPDADIQSVGITNQRETTVVWDSRTGQPLSRAIVWQCRRTASFCNRLKQKII